MSKLDLTHFKKVSSDGNSTTLRHSKDGHEIKVNHATVPPGVLDGLNRLKVYGYSNGGKVDSDEEIRKMSEDAARKSLEDSGYGYKSPQPYHDKKIEESPTISPEEGNKPSEELSGFKNYQPTATESPRDVASEDDLSLGDLESEDTSPVTNALDQQQPQVSAAANTEFENSYNQQIKGLKEQAAVQQKLSNDVVAIEKERQRQQQEEVDLYKQKIAPYEKSINGFNSWLQANPQNPKRYIQNMSTGEKITTAIGLLLGGIGSGMTRGPNLAAKYLEDQIEQDIKSQQSDIDTKKSLYGYNLQALGNERDAYNMTKVQMHDLMSSRLEEVKAKAQNSNAVAALDYNIGKSQQSKIITMSKLANSGHAQERFVPGYGYAQIKPTDKDREVLATVGDIKSGLEELKGRANTIGTTFPFSDNEEINKNKVSSIQLKMKTAYQLGVLSKSDYDMLDKLVADPGAVLTERAIKLLDSTLQSMEGTERSILSKLGIAQKQRPKSNQYEGKTGTLNGVRVINKGGKWVPIGK